MQRLDVPSVRGLGIVVLALILASCQIGSGTSTAVSTGISATAAGEATLVRPAIPRAPVVLSSQTPARASSTPRTANTSTQVVAIVGTPPELCEQVPEPRVTKPGGSSADVHLEGEVSLCSLGPQSTFDLDGGIVAGLDSVAADIALELGKATIDNRIVYYLSEINDAHVAAAGVDLPTPKYCNDLTASSTRLGFAFGTAGTVGCVLTNEGRLAFFRVEQIDQFGAESIRMTFVTWGLAK